MMDNKIDFANVLADIRYSPGKSLIARCRRRLTQWTSVAGMTAPQRSVITISFDDFPKTAADTGAEIVESIGARAIYYACTGLSERTNLTGLQYDAEDLLRLVKAGHEIGAHTHTHVDCTSRPVETVIADIEYNLAQLVEMGHTDPVRHFAYPYGETSPKLKRALISRFDSCRGILAGANATRADLMQLRAMELTPDPATHSRALGAIESACKTPQWLNIFTHDVRQTPSAYGIKPNDFRAIVRAAKDSGLEILTPRDAIKHLEPHSQ